MSEGPFRLPRPPRDYRDDASARFVPNAWGSLGVYEPGRPPVLYDPRVTGDATSFATLAHEEAHQRLTINTPFGLLHQVLVKAARKGKHGREHAMSIEAQWCVQELCATYAELYAIALRAPKQLDAAIERLPSDALGEAPYREVFEYIRQHLPLEPELGPTRLGAHQLLVYSLAMCSMANDCLLAFAEPAAMTPERFEEYLRRESPALRFERIVARLVESGRLRLLVNELEPFIDKMRRGVRADEAGIYAI